MGGGREYALGDDHQRGLVEERQDRLHVKGTNRAVILMQHPDDACLIIVDTAGGPHRMIISSKGNVALSQSGRYNRRNRQAREPSIAMEIDLDDVSVEFCTRNYPLEAEPICALWQYDGTIYLQEDDDDDPTRIGTMLVYRLLPSVAHDAGVSLLDALDYISEDTAQYIALLDDEGTEFNEDVRKQYDDCICSSLLILDSVEIDQPYRGHGIGLLAARHAIELAENGALVACRPFPLQFAGYQGEEWKRDHPNLGQQDFEAAVEKLRRL